MQYERRRPSAPFPAGLLGACLILFATGSAFAQSAEDDHGVVTVPDEPHLVEWRALGPDRVPAPDAISTFVRRIFEDSQGNLWLGTNGDGVARFDGESLGYFAASDGFSGEAVRGIVEDHDRNLWFATNRGVTRYADGRFTHYTTTDGLSADDTWVVFVDGSGTVWAGTQDGPCIFDGHRFVPIAIPPAAEPDHRRGVSGRRLVRDIMEDSTGRIWIAAEGGVFHYDGVSVTNFSEGTALQDRSINCMLEDGDGNFWFATHYDGVLRTDGRTFTNVVHDAGLQGTEVWNLYLDHDGSIWFPIENEGLVHTDGRIHRTFSEAQGVLGGAIQTTYRDRTGRLWAGGYLGLFRLEGDAFVAVGRDGPW